MKIQSSTKANREFFPALHGLRGIAVLYVVVSHLGIRGLFLFPILHNAIGKVGVWIFFVLSAFLLTTHLYYDIEISSSKFFSILQYTVHRVFRIYPLFLCVLILHAIRGDISILGIFGHLLLIRGREELWAIPVEFQYYFIMPVIVISTIYISQKYANLLLMTSLIVTLLYGMMHPEEVFSNGLNIIPKLPPFLLGSMLSLLFYKKDISSLGSRFRFISLIPIISLTMLIITTVFFRRISLGTLPNFYAPWLSGAIGISVAGLIYSALLLPSFSKFIGAKPLVFLGEISFSIYLLHFFIIDIVKNIPNLSTTAQAWISLGLSIICAYISYRVIEKPGISLGKKIAQSLQKTDLIRQTHSTVNNDERA